MNFNPVLYVFRLVIHVVVWYPTLFVAKWLLISQANCKEIVRGPLINRASTCQGTRSHVPICDHVGAHHCKICAPTYANPPETQVSSLLRRHSPVCSVSLPTDIKILLIFSYISHPPAVKHSPLKPPQATAENGARWSLKDAANIAGMLFIISPLQSDNLTGMKKNDLCAIYEDLCAIYESTARIWCSRLWIKQVGGRRVDITR